MFDFLIDIVPRDDADAEGAEEDDQGGVSVELGGREMALVEDGEGDERFSRGTLEEERGVMKVETGTRRRDTIEESMGERGEADGEGLIGEFIERNG